MSLHPQMQQLLEQLAALGGPRLETLPPAEARRFYAAIGALGGEPPGIDHVSDLEIPGPAGAIPARLYRPEGAAGTLVYFHGGGWVIGSLETHDALCRELAVRAGCAVVSVDYRLAPEHKFPAAVEDAYAAVRWAAAEGPALGLDAARLAVGGDSAGGNLATVVSLLIRDQGGPPLRAQLLLYPTTAHHRDTQSHRDFGEGYLLTAPMMAWFSSHYLRGSEDARHPHVAPLYAEDLRGLPQALIATAEFDPLRDEGEAYADRLRAAGIPVWCRRYDGLVHGFLQMIGAVSPARDALGEIAARLREALHG